MFDESQLLAPREREREIVDAPQRRERDIDREKENARQRERDSPLDVGGSTTFFMFYESQLLAPRERE